MREMDDENVLPSRQAIHPIHITKAPKTNGHQPQQQHHLQQHQHIYSYENATIGLESNEPTLKMNRIHANNIINGCTLELHPISIEQNNGNHLVNNNQAALYRLNNNNANNINNNHHAGNNDDSNDNNHLKRALKTGRNGATTTYAMKTMRTHDQNHLGKNNHYIKNEMIK